MYIVRRSFRNLGQMLTAGTVITDPAVIKHFKSRIGAGNIIVVTEQNYDSCKAFFKGRHNVDIPALPTDTKSSVKGTIIRGAARARTTKSEGVTDK